MQGDLFGHKSHAEEWRTARAKFEEYLAEGKGEELAEGRECPCCRKTVILYDRTIIGLQAKWLIWLCRVTPEDGWTFVRDAGDYWGIGGAYARLKHWGLIVQKPNLSDPRRSRNHSGVWRPTKRGREFALDEIRVSKHRFVYNGVLLHTSGPMISVHDALGEKFDFRDLWERPI